MAGIARMLVGDRLWGNLKPPLELATREPGSFLHLPVLIGNRQLEDALAKVHRNGSSIHVNPSPLDLAEMTRSQLGTTMPLKEREESIPSFVVRRLQLATAHAARQTRTSGTKGDSHEDNGRLSLWRHHLRGGD
jgi:hypothetical protein